MEKTISSEMVRAYLYAAAWWLASCALRPFISHETILKDGTLGAALMNVGDRYVVWTAAAISLFTAGIAAGIATIGPHSWRPAMWDQAKTMFDDAFTVIYITAGWYAALYSFRQNLGIDARINLIGWLAMICLLGSSSALSGYLSASWRKTAKPPKE